MRKFLYSPGYGAGWSTWAHGGREEQEFFLFYQPIIDFIESGGEFTQDECELKWHNDTPDVSHLHPVLRQFVEDFQARFGDGSFCYVGGARDLVVGTADDESHFVIKEYDGAESVQFRDATEWF